MRKSSAVRSPASTAAATPVDLGDRRCRRSRARPRRRAGRPRPARRARRRRDSVVEDRRDDRQPARPRTSSRADDRARRSCASSPTRREARDVALEQVGRAGALAREALGRHAEVLGERERRRCSVTSGSSNTAAHSTLGRARARAARSSRRVIGLRRGASPRRNTRAHAPVLVVALGEVDARVAAARLGAQPRGVRDERRRP